MARLLTDEDFPRPAADELRHLGHDVETAVTMRIANLETPDDQVLALARQENRIVVTHNRQDYVKLHRAGVPHAGVVVCRHDQDTNRLTRNVHCALEANPCLQNRVLRVRRDGTTQLDAPAQRPPGEPTP